jgi:sugar transferase (PEP-CTERM/EpsH1 system associated)
MRILFLTHRIPFPPNKGDKIRSFNILSYLSQRHEVYVGSLIDDETDLQFVPEVQARSQAFVFAPVHDSWRKALAIRSIVLSRSITVDYFYSRTLQRRIDELIDGHDFDVVLCFSSPMAEYVFRSRHINGRLRDTVKIMDLIDVDSRKWSEYAGSSPGWKSWIYEHEARYLALYEREIAQRFRHVVVVSEQERALFPYPASNLHAISNGVDLSFFSPQFRGALSLESPALVFTGVMDYLPNIEGVKWFTERVFPKIQAQIPHVHLYVVGSRPSGEIRRLQGPAITVTGYVQDVRDYVAGASVCIVPLRIARGVQNKVLEAMAMGKAVVSTPQAFEGLQAEAGKDILVAADEDAFAAATVELLRNPQRRCEIAAAARRCVEQHYGWDRNLSRLEELMQTP